MKRYENMSGWMWLLSKEAWLVLWIPIALVSMGHYITIPGLHWLHDIFRRLYYLPIILGAFVFGLRGALVASLAASIIYFPHAFSHLVNQDPAKTLEKVLEILLYNVIALITGMLAEREYKERIRQRTIARRLQETLDEMKIMEEQLIRAGRLQALGQLTAGLAHEIRNPLASLKGATEILSDEIPENSPRRKMVTILENELNRLGSLLDRFLSFARPQQLDMVPTELDWIVEHVLTLAESQLKNSRVSFEHIRTESGPITVTVNHEQITQVFLNIILNASQAMPDGGNLTVRTGLDRKNKRHYIKIVFDDTGPGVPPDIKEQIFNPFFTTSDMGTGLGLSIANRIVDQHGGHIDVSDNPDGGARFQVLLPFDTVPNTDAALRGVQK